MSYAGELPVVIMEPKKKWSDNFMEDDNNSGFGTYYCSDKKCRANCGGRL
jgi:hypothetical protein